MPAVGLGTFQVKEEAGYEAVKAAINVRNAKMGVCLRAFVHINRLPALPSQLGRREKPGIKG